MTLATLLIAGWMLGVAVIAVNERRHMGPVEVWTGSRLLWVLILAWPVSLTVHFLLGPALDRLTDNEDEEAS